MLAVALAVLLCFDQPDRTPAIYRCPAEEAEGERLPHLVDEDGYSFLCVDPKPGPKARATAKGKVTFVSPKSIDTPANRRWRDATIAMVQGKLSPKAWLHRTRNLHETVHYISSPTTPDLRSVCGNESGPAVFAEILTLSWPGRPCLTSTDTWNTRWLPEAGRLQSWILAMHDLLGPMLQFRHDNPALVTHKPEILRADSKPGLLVFRQPGADATLTFYFNASNGPIELPPVDLDHVIGIERGVNVDGPKPFLQKWGFIIEEIKKVK